MDLLNIYQQWCKDTKRTGSVLAGKSVEEFLSYLEDKLNSDNIQIAESADGELCIMREDEQGEHYIVADGSMSYVLVTKTPGKYKVLNTENGVSVFDIVANFLKNKK